MIQSVRSLYELVRIKFNEYSEKLFKKEGTVPSIIGDRIQKIFDREARKRKDLFLVGNEIER